MKRAVGASGPRKKVKSQQTQTSIATFFSPGKGARATSVIEVSDSEDDIVAIAPEASNGNGKGKGKAAGFMIQKDEDDEALARRLAEEWAREDAERSKGDSESTAPVHPLFTKPSPSTKRIPSPSTQPMASSSKLTEGSPSKPSKPSPKGPATFTSKTHATIKTIDFDSDDMLFRPDEIDITAWNGRVPYAILVGVYVQVAATRSRLTIVRVLTNFIHLVLARCPQDLSPALYLLSNHLKPAYLPCELGIGSMILNRAIKEVSGAQPRDLRKFWEATGDPGDVAFAAKVNMRTLVQPAPLMVADVYKRVLSLSDIKGPQSGKIKGDVVRKLMVQARGEEVRYLVRTLVGNLRIGAVRLTLLTALARAAALHAMLAEGVLEVLPLQEKGKKPIDEVREAATERCAAAVRLVRKVYVRHPNYSDLVAGIKEGLDDLDIRVPLSVGIPISPMLGSITRSLEEVYTLLGSLPFTAETKLDGQRLQMHIRRDGPQGEDDGGGRWVEGKGKRVWVRLFSRHLEDMTDKYPDVCALALQLLSHPREIAARLPFPPTTLAPLPAVSALLETDTLTSLIVDAEIVAVDRETGAHRTFQELTNRARKDVKVEDIKVVVEVSAFDLMLLNDVPLLSSPFAHRRHLLRALLPPRKPTDPLLARWSHIASIDSTDLKSKDDLRAFFDHVVEQKAEGLMVKLLEGGVDDMDDEPKEEKKTRRKALPATYEPDQRSQGWLKVKKDYLEGLGDSLDLVPIGAWWGTGRKAGWWSPILLAARNPDSGALEAVCKCMSGFSDAFYKDLTRRYPAEGEPEVASKLAPLGYVESPLVPDIWFVPREVWEIRGADITLSPVYTAGAEYIGGERGLSLRFPRFIRVREDKGVEEATSSEEFTEMFRRQMERPVDRVVGRAGSEGEGEGEGEGGEVEGLGEGAELEDEARVEEEGMK